MEQTVGQTIAVWIGAFLTLGTYSFLYKDNPAYKFCESLYVGLSAGYWFVQIWARRFVPDLWERLIYGPISGKQPWEALNWLYIFAAIIGVLILFRLSRKMNWISRYPITFMVGFGSGLSIVRIMQSYLFAQVQHTIIPWDNWNAVILTIGVITGLIYFFFSMEHKGVVGGAAKIGIYFLMIAFGASFGYTVMARISLLIGRLDFLLGSWLHIIH
jgi:hypothetical protein